MGSAKTGHVNAVASAKTVPVNGVPSYQEPALPPNCPSGDFAGPFQARKNLPKTLDTSLDPDMIEATSSQLLRLNEVHLSYLLSVFCLSLSRFDFKSGLFSVPAPSFR